MTTYIPGSRAAVTPRLLPWCSRRRQREHALLVRTIAAVTRERDELAEELRVATTS
jgi:hypothetical protein